MPSCRLSIHLSASGRRTGTLTGLTLLVLLIVVSPARALAGPGAAGSTGGLAAVLTSAAATVEPAAPVVKQVTDTAVGTVAAVTTAAAPVVHQLTTAATSTVAAVTSTAGVAVPVSPTAPPSSSSLLRKAPAAAPGDPPAHRVIAPTPTALPGGKLRADPVRTKPASSAGGTLGDQAVGGHSPLAGTNAVVANAPAPGVADVSGADPLLATSKSLPLPMPIRTLPLISAPTSSFAVSGTGAGAMDSLGVLFLLLSLAAVFAGRRRGFR